MSDPAGRSESETLHITWCNECDRFAAPGEHWHCARCGSKVELRGGA